MTPAESNECHGFHLRHLQGRRRRMKNGLDDCCSMRSHRNCGSRADRDVKVTPVECLSVCKRPCTIALMAAGKWTYVVGDLDPEVNVDDVISMAVRYGLSRQRHRPMARTTAILP